MFRHAFIYQLKGCGGVPVAIDKSITGHGRNAYELAHYGSVCYTLGQKKAVMSLADDNHRLNHQKINWRTPFVPNHSGID